MGYNTGPNRIPRKYEEVWNILKKDGRIELEVHPKFVKTVKRMVAKEKHLDLGFKLLNENDNFILYPSYNRETKRLTFVLKATIGIEDKVV